MIVKNEEKYLEECLLSARDVVDEIVVVDTGSTDATKQIAEKFSARIYDFKWVNDFSAARNFALSKASEDWILYLDADERLAESSREIIKRAAKRTDRVGFFCSVVSPSEATGAPSVMKFLRFFRRHPQAKFTGKVHEQIEPSLRALGYALEDSEIVINHIGYNVDKNLLRRKAERNLKLLLADYAENPSAYNAFQIGQTYLFLDDADKANFYFKKVLENPTLDENHIAQTLRYLGAYELEKNNLAQAKAYVSKGLELSPASPLLHVLAANIALQLGENTEAARHAKEAYRFNAELLSGKRSSKFDILIDEKNMLLYGINLSILISDRELFSFFYPKVRKIKIAENDKKLLDFYDDIFSRGEIKESALSEISAIKNKINDVALANSLRFLKDEYAKRYIRALVRNFSESYAVNFAAGEKLFELDAERSVQFFERALELNPADLQTVWRLFNLYFGKLDLKKLKTLSDHVARYHPENEELKSVLKRITDKLENLPDVRK